jgi:hypothetical protein
MDVSHLNAGRSLSLWRLSIVSFVMVCLCGPMSAGPVEDCPFSKIGKDPIAAVYLKSWQAEWDLYKAPNLSGAILKTLREEVIPALLKIADATGPARDLPQALDDLTKAADWEDLARSAIQAVISKDEHGDPLISVQITPFGGKTDKVFDDLGRLLQTAVGKSDGKLVWTQSGELLTTGVPAEGILKLRKLDESVWITLGSDPREILSGGGFAAKPSFVRLWSQLPDQAVSGAVIDFDELSVLFSKFAGEILPTTPEMQWESSLVLDETMEALFKDDPETLAKLKQTQRTFEQLTPPNQKNALKAIDRLAKLLADQGMILTCNSPVPQGVAGTILWLPRPGSDGAIFGEVAPLSPRFLGLLRPGPVEISISGLPDFQRILHLILDFIRLLPDGESLLEAWDVLQETAGFSLEKDLLPAIGKEVAWLTERSEKLSFPGFQVMDNDLYLALDIADKQAAKSSLQRLEKVLSENGLPVSATQEGGANISLLDTGLLGKVRWGILEEPPTFVLATGTAKNLGGFLQSLAHPAPNRLSEHPRWNDLKAIWHEKPTAVALYDLTTTWKQTIDQLKGGQMMLAMMGQAGSAGLPFIRLGLKIMQEIPPPDCLLEVGANEGDIRALRSLLLFPAGKPGE